MRKSDKVDRYLRQLERELADMPDDHRAQVVTEIESQIKKGLAEGRSAGTVLREVGSPKLIAMSHMKLRPKTGEPRSPWLRWAAIATVVFFGLVFAFGLTWIRRNWNRRNKSAPVAESALAKPAQVTPDSRNLREFKVHSVVIPFTTGRLSLTSGPDDILSWSCVGSPQVEVLGSELTLNLDRFDAARCDITVPPGITVKMRGTNGHLDIKHARTALDVSLVNGRVGVTPEPGRSYDYDVHVKNGLQDFFKPSSKPGAIKVRIVVTNGTVKKE